MEFPVTVKTRAGTEVVLLGYDKDSERPWVGVVSTHLIDIKYNQPYSWLPSGRYHSEETKRSLDLDLTTVE